MKMLHSSYLHSIFIIMLKMPIAILLLFSSNDCYDVVVLYWLLVLIVALYKIVIIIVICHDYYSICYYCMLFGYMVGCRNGRTVRYIFCFHFAIDIEYCVYLHRKK